MIGGRLPENDPYSDIYANGNSEVNDDLRFSALNSKKAIIRKRENLMDIQDFLHLMRSANEKQDFC